MTLACGEGAVLQVCDSGRAVRAEIATTLLREPVRSGSGLGIGLYQAQARTLIPGDVVYADHAIGRFDLHGASGMKIAPPKIFVH